MGTGVSDVIELAISRLRVREVLPRTRIELKAVLSA
jgi:hypothetical protein